jgi:hypothetical protein
LSLVRHRGEIAFDAGRGKPMQEWVALTTEGTPWVEFAKEAYRSVDGGQV